MAILPSDVPTRLVTATMYFVNEDSVDPDTKPEYTVVTGSVVFTASPKTLRMPTKPAILVPLTFEGVFNSEGQLIPKDGTGVGMELIVTDSPLLNPTDWTWTCTFNLKVAGTQNTVNIDSFSFQLPAGTEPLDLVSLMPVSASGGVLTIQGPPGEAGPNTVPTTEFMVSEISNPASPVAAALSAAISDQTEPIVNGLVVDAIAADPTVANAAAAAVNANPTITAIQAALPWRGVLPNGTDINTLRIPGIYTVTSTASAVTMINWPTARAGILTVWKNDGASATTQDVTGYVSTTAPTEKYSRATLVSANTSWSPWVTAEWLKGIANGTPEVPLNFDTFRNPGKYLVASRTNVTGLPGTLTGVVEIITAPGTGLAHQIFWERLSNSEVTRWERFTLTSSGWAGIAWEDQTPTSSGGSALTPADPVSDHAGRVEYARSRRGGGTGTGGKAVVMLRFDHWLLKFRDVILPIMREHSLPGTLNVNYDNLTNVQNGGGSITWGHVQDWNQYDGIEIANHGATHTNAATRETIYHEVVEGRRNLETAMPRVAVETWHEHGSAYLIASDIEGDTGLNLGREPKNFFESYAGKLVLAEHAIIEGKCGGFFVNLAGEPQIGQSHMSIDQSTAAQAIGQVETAKTFGRGVTLYVHPGLMDTVLVGSKAWDVVYNVDGSVDVTDPATSSATHYNTKADFQSWATTNGHTVYMSVDHFREMCAYLAAERDAGNIMVMTAAGGAFADKNHTRRENLLVNPGFTGDVTTWWGGTTPWAISTPGPDVVLTAPITAATLSQGMLMHSRFGWAMGAAHELLVKVRSNTAASLTLRVEKLGDPATWQTERVHTIPGDGVEREYRLNLTLPRDPTITQMSIKITGNNGLEIVGAPLLAAI